MSKPHAEVADPEAPGFQVLDPRVVWLWRTSGVSGVLLALAGSAAASALLLEAPPSPALWVLATLLGLGVAWSAAALRYAGWRFGLRSIDLRVRRGVLVRTTSVIPLSRIQHVDTQQDLLERWLGLASVVVYTAGVRGAQVALPGLTLAEAEALRDRLAAFAGDADHAV